jgi:Outer membrane protein beta-barrel domain
LNHKDEKMKKIINSLVLLISVNFYCFSQESIEIGLVVSPLLSKISFESSHSFNTESRVSVNYGSQFSYSINKLRINTGISYLKQGGDLKVLETPTTNPSGNGNYFYVPFITKSIVVPTTLNYKIFSKNKTKLFVGTGLAIGYLFAQYQDNSAFETPQVQTVTINGITYTISGAGIPKHTQLDIFDKFYSHISLCTELNHSFKNNWNGFIRPNFNYQIRSKNSSQFTWRQSSWGLDFGIMKQIK